jgi:hypothetical protein
MLDKNTYPRKHARTRTRVANTCEGRKQKQDIKSPCSGRREFRNRLSRAGGATNSECSHQSSRPAAKFEREDKKTSLSDGDEKSGGEDASFSGGYERHTRGIERELDGSAGIEYCSADLHHLLTKVSFHVDVLVADVAKPSPIYKYTTKPETLSVE